MNRTDRALDLDLHFASVPRDETLGLTPDTSDRRASALAALVTIGSLVWGLALYGAVRIVMDLIGVLGGAR